MSREVIEVSVDQTMTEAASAFAERHVSSAPVVDERGRCVGMLSAADFMKRECPNRGQQLSQSATGESGSKSPAASGARGDMVGCYMSPAPLSVVESDSLLHAARVMSADHIHHLPVLEDDRLIGVISTMDIVAALINAVDELEVQMAPREH